jgi:hypothetical protein
VTYLNKVEAPAAGVRDVSRDEFALDACSEHGARRANARAHRRQLGLLYIREQAYAI